MNFSILCYIYVTVHCEKIVFHKSDQMLLQIFGFLVGIKADACNIEEVTTCWLEAVMKPGVFPYWLDERGISDDGISWQKAGRCHHANQ